VPYYSHKRAGKSVMRVTNEGIKLKTVNKAIIKESESLQLKAYLCPAGVWTIGWGHTKGVKAGDTCTIDEAEVMLSSDLLDAEYAVNKCVKVDLNQNQFDALVSFVFNVGGGNFKSSTMLRKLNAGDYAGAANEFKRWNKAGGRVLNGLTIRREKESKLFKEG
jgi:lysozyme